MLYNIKVYWFLCQRCEILNNDLDNPFPGLTVIFSVDLYQMTPALS